MRKIRTTEKDIENFTCGKRHYLPCICDGYIRLGKQVIHTPVATYDCKVTDVWDTGQVKILTIEDFEDKRCLRYL